MTRQGRELFDEYLLDMLANLDARETALEIHTNQLIEQTRAVDGRISDIEAEVGEIKDAMEQKLKPL